MLRNTHELVRNLNAHSFEHVRKLLFKHTDCGAFINEIEGGIELGSTVEGIEAVAGPHNLYYPFTPDDFWDMVSMVEREAGDLWNETHGCLSCGEEDPETGYIRVDPNCLECEGYGESF